MRSADLSSVLDRYLDRLARDARRKRCPFSRSVDGQQYQYRGELDGEGAIFATRDRRIAFLEAVGDSSTARRRVLARAQNSFEVGERDRWSVLGLDLTLPRPLRVERKEFLAGRTSLVLSRRGVRVVAERWGLAESLLAQTDLQMWARNRLGNGWRVEADGPGLRGGRSTPFGNEEAIVVHQPKANQITLIRTRSRSVEWRPQWDWSN